MSGFTGHVTHLVSGDLWGGAEAVVLALAREQQRERPNCVSCVVMNPGRLAAELVSSGIKTTVLDEQHCSFAALLRAVRAILRRKPPQIIHSHRQKENLLAVLGSVGMSRVACVTTVHGMPEPFRTGNVLRRTAKNLANHAVLRYGCDAIVAVSRDIRDALGSSYPNGRVVCIHNGVKLPDATRAIAQHHSPLRLLALGRLVPVKRFDRLKVLSDLLGRSALGRPLITLAGDGPLESELHTLLQPDIADALVRMPGFVVDTNALLSASDGLVMTSDHEGIPMAVLEALAIGVPVFGFSVGGLPEIAGPDIPLTLVPPGDTAALAKAIEKYFTSRAHSAPSGPPSDWAFGIAQCAQTYDQLYEVVTRRHLTKAARD